MSDQKNYFHVGVDRRFISSRKSSALTKDVDYECRYSEVMKEERKIVEHCEQFSSTKGQLSTHVHQMHLGIAVACFICNKRWWSAFTWYEHMKKAHGDLKTDDHYLKEGAEEELEGRTIHRVPTFFL